MQRRGLKNSLRDRNGSRRPEKGTDTDENPRKTGLSRVGVGICGFAGLDGGRDRDRTCDPLDVNEVLSR
jgi:hypothetical protein